MGSKDSGALRTRLTVLAISLSCEPLSSGSQVIGGVDSGISPCWEPSFLEFQN